MAKLPRPGAVKTRLRDSLSDSQCADLYQAFLDDKVDSVCALGGAVPVLAFTPVDAEHVFADRYGSRVRLLPQRGADLGERLANVAERLFGHGYAGVVLLDSDTPNLPAAHLATAVSILADSADLVLGPTHDGGYYLLGTRRFTPELFRGIAWSTSSVTGQTLAVARRLGLGVHVLPSWYDVDTPEDLARLSRDVRELTAGPGYPRHTAQALAAIQAAGRGASGA